MNTRVAFKTLLRLCRADCICDIGSCDGSDSLKFRKLLPKARVVAFEANPFLYKQMAANPSLAGNRIEVFPFAITNQNGTAPFHVTDVDYDGPGVREEANVGTSSLLVHEGLKVRQTVEVQTRRIDEFLLSRYPEARRVGLWVDTEGAEFGVLEGMVGIKDRVLAVHVETALTPLRLGQKVTMEVESLMRSFGFIPLGSNMSKGSIWGDVVFVNANAAGGLGFRFHLCRWVGWLSGWCRLGAFAGLLKKH